MSCNFISFHICVITDENANTYLIPPTSEKVLDFSLLQKRGLFSAPFLVISNCNKITVICAKRRFHVSEKTECCQLRKKLNLICLKPLVFAKMVYLNTLLALSAKTGYLLKVGIVVSNFTVSREFADFVRAIQIEDINLPRWIHIEVVRGRRGSLQTLGASKAKKMEFCSSPTILGLFDYIKGHLNGICFFCPLS